MIIFHNKRKEQHFLLKIFLFWVYKKEVSSSSNRRGKERLKDEMCLYVWGMEYMNGSGMVHVVWAISGKSMVVCSVKWTTLKKEC